MCGSVFQLKINLVGVVLFTQILNTSDGVYLMGALQTSGY